MITYTTVGPDGIIRMALHPMDSAPGYRREDIGPKDFSFRVLFCRSEYDFWRASCRGQDTRPVVNYAEHERDMLAAGHVFSWEHDAMRWLLEGE